MSKDTTAKKKTAKKPEPPKYQQEIIESLCKAIECSQMTASCRVDHLAKVRKLNS